jgi:Ca-activated chloride channel family protein
MAATAGDSSACCRFLQLDLALMLDTGSSMAGGKLEAAKVAAAVMIRQLRGDDTLSMISFDSEVRVHLDGMRLRRGRRRALAAAKGLETGSCTCVSGG